MSQFLQKYSYITLLFFYLTWTDAYFKAHEQHSSKKKTIQV